MSFIPEFYFLISIFFIFNFSILVSNSVLFSYIKTLKYLYFLYIVAVVNTVYLVGTDLQLHFYYLYTFVLKTDFTTILEFLLLIMFLVLLINIYNYNFNIQLLNIEYIFILSICFICIIFFINLINLLLLFICLELISLCLYIIASINKYSIYSIESGLKYFIIGSFSSFFVLIGIIFLYGYTGTINLLDLSHLFLFFDSFKSNSFFLGIVASLFFIIIGFLFKIYSAPFHFWILDIYQGAPISSSFFFSTIYLISIIYVFFKIYILILLNFFIYFKYIYLFFSISSICFGTLGSIIQTKIRKLICYSSINVIGFFIVTWATIDCCMIQVGFLFFTTYIINISSFFIIILNFFINYKHSINELYDFHLLSKTKFEFSFFIAFLIFSISGLPPFFFFFCKLFFFNILIINLHWFIYLLVIITGLLSFFYYLRIIKIIYDIQIHIKSAQLLNYRYFSIVFLFVFFYISYFNLCFSTFISNISTFFIFDFFF